MAIGDFSRATHLNIKTLRHYHRIGLLVPSDVDPMTGHRRYTSDQIPTAQIIRRFRALDMPLEEIGAIVKTTDLALRNQLITNHLFRLEATLARTQDAAASLHDLLEPPTDAIPAAIEHRRMPATTAAVVSEVIDVKDASAWYQGALGELYGLLNAQKITPSASARSIVARRQPLYPASSRYARPVARSHSFCLRSSSRSRCTKVIIPTWTSPPT
jgi:DNA-binding transcriptional MerR regulator